MFKTIFQSSIGFLIPLVLVVGLATGVLVRPTIDRLLEASPASDPHDSLGHSAQADDESHDDHLPLSFEAVQNLNLLVRPIELKDFTEVGRMPGEIVESPGLSSQKVAAPVSGKVVRLFASPGVSISPGDRLLELEIIDDQLMQAQLKLLELHTRHEIVSAELERLKPLAEAGGIAERKKLELQYEQKEVDASLSRTRQELAMRGLAAEQIESIEQSGKAVTKYTVFAPAIGQTARSAEQSDAAIVEANMERIESSLTMEDLLVEVGKNVARGDAVCSLAVHGVLMVCGHAFETEIDLVSQIASDNTPVTIQFGTSEQAKQGEGFHIQYVAGHVDETTQTFHFFMPLVNEVVRESSDSLGRVFRTWRHKVGQRVHVLAPTRTLEQQIILPRKAVVQDGPSYYVFREVVGAHSHPHEGVYMEMEPVPVRVVARDKNSIVVAPGGQVKVGDMVAINAAYKLHLAFKSQQAGGGGGQHHGHSH